MKSPEEIKQGIECCYAMNCNCINRGCPYIGMSLCHDHVLKDARDYILKLEASVPRWIPVEERLPEEKELVLVHYTDDWMPVAFLLNGNWFNSGGERSWLSVTHWMPLPEPPEVTKP